MTNVKDEGVMEVLLIDDEPHFGEFVERKLSRTDPNTKVDQQWNCETGIAQLTSKKFDIVLMDYRLVSGPSGLE